MDRTTCRDERVVKWLGANAIAVVLDVDKETEVAKDLSIEAMPTMIAFKDGKEFDRVVGYKAPEEFLVWIEGIARGEKSIEAVKKRAGTSDPGRGKVDVRARLDLARSLAQTGEHEAAAEEYVWLWQHMLEHDRGFYGVRLSFMAGDMERLAVRSEAAMRKFTTLRDEAAESIEGDKVDREGVTDWVALNKIIGDTEATLVWYDKVKEDARWKPLLNRLSRDLEELLIAENRWADVGRIYSHPIEELERQRRFIAMIPKHDPPPGLPEEGRRQLEEMPRRMVREKVYAGLLAAGREADADRLAARAREVDDSSAMLVALISTAVKAEQARRCHLEWVESAETKGSTLADLQASVEAALRKIK